MAIEEEVGEGLQKIIKSLPSSLENIVKKFQEGGPLSALGAAATSIGSSILKQEAFEDQRDAINDATAKYMAGIEQLIALENIFSDEQKEKLSEAYGLTQEQLTQSLQTDPQFIVDAYKYVEDSFDPQITERYSNTINELSDGLQSLTEDQMTAFEDGLNQANSYIDDADRVLHFGYDDAGNQLSVAKGNILSGTGEARQIIGGLSNFGDQELQQGFREATGLSTPYLQQGQQGLNAFANTALDPNSQLFQRNLGLASESLNQQLASRGLLDSGAGIEAQSDLIQKMTLEEMNRQTDLQRQLAEMGMSQIGNTQDLLSRSASERVQLAKELGLVDANFVMENAQQQAEIDKLLAENSINEAVRSGQLTQQQADYAIQTGQQQGGAISDYMNNIANIQGQGANQIYQYDADTQRQISDARNQAVQSAVQRGMNLQDALNQFPLEMFQQNYNIDRSRLDQISDLEVGQMNREQEALSALANIDGMDSLGLAQALSRMGGGGGTSIAGGGGMDVGALLKSAWNSDFIRTLRDGGDMRSALAALPSVAGQMFQTTTQPAPDPLANDATSTPTNGGNYINSQGGNTWSVQNPFSYELDRFVDEANGWDWGPTESDVNLPSSGYDIPDSGDWTPTIPDYNFDVQPTDDDFFNPPDPDNNGMLDVDVLYKPGRGKAGDPNQPNINGDWIPSYDYLFNPSNPDSMSAVSGLFKTGTGIAKAGDPNQPTTGMDTRGYTNPFADQVMSMTPEQAQAQLDSGENFTGLYRDALLARINGGDVVNSGNAGPMYGSEPESTPMPDNSPELTPIPDNSPIITNWEQAQVSEQQNLEDWKKQLQHEINVYQHLANESNKMGQRPNYRQLADSEVAIQQRRYLLENPNATEIPDFGTRFAGNIRGTYYPPKFTNFYSPSPEYTQAQNEYNTYMSSPREQMSTGVADNGDLIYSSSMINGQYNNGAFAVDANGNPLNTGTVHYGGEEVTDPEQRLAILKLNNYAYNNPNANYTDYYGNNNQEVMGGWGDSGLREMYNNIQNSGLPSDTNIEPSQQNTTPVQEPQEPQGPRYNPQTVTMPTYDFMNRDNSGSTYNTNPAFNTSGGFGDYLTQQRTNRTTSNPYSGDQIRRFNSPRGFSNYLRR